MKQRDEQANAPDESVEFEPIQARETINEPIDPAFGEPKPAVHGRVRTPLLCIIAGLCIAASVPPWGWWPTALVAFAIVDQLLKGASTKSRFARMWLVAIAWMYPAMLWMFDLIAPGYIAVVPFFGIFFGIVAVLTPHTSARRWVLPGAIALAEWVRWSWPFGGVPLANLAMTQVNSPLGQSARLLGPLLIVALVVIVGQAISAFFDSLTARRSPSAAAPGAGSPWRAGVVGLIVCALAVAASYFHPRATVVGDTTVALVQGGGPQQTRASADQQPVVLARHIEATRQIDEPVDLVIWPENVVNPGALLPRRNADALVRQVAVEQDAPILAGWFFPVSETETVNYQSVITPDGDETDRYDKVRLVPFGEFVPLRSLVEMVNEDIPVADVRVGTVEPVLDTPQGPVGVAISWEGFFEHRYRDAIDNGAEMMINPTNGSSYWLTQVQTQQVASNQLRAIETDRWVMQVAPTGMSAFVDPDGNVKQRTGVSERAVLVGTVDRRQGRTLASIVGVWPMLLIGVATLLLSGLKRRFFDPGVRSR